MGRSRSLYQRPYQRASVTAVQLVAGWARTCSRVGSRDPTRQGRPFRRGARGGGGGHRWASRRKRVIESRDRAHGVEQIQSGVAAVSETTNGPVNQ